MAEPWTLTLTEMVDQIKKKQLSTVTLMESILKRMDARESRLQAWVTIDRDRALKEAELRRGEIGRRKFPGPLRGIPIGVKDIFLTAGIRTTGGSKSLDQFVPTYDATAVDRLRKAGAIILGKTATTEFAFQDPAPTRNPWNREHTPGGSSSGSAAAVAAGMCPAALGSQTGGSVLRPAAYCGVVGFKPTYGRVSRHGVLPLSWTLDHIGFFTRCVEDSALLLAVLAGYDPLDPGSSRKPVPDYTRFLRPPRKPPRIGLVSGYFQENALPEVWEHTKGVARELAKAGARVEEVGLPLSFSRVPDAHRIIMKTEGASVHEDFFNAHKEQYGPKMRELVEVGLLIPAADYLRAHKIKRQFRREMDGLMGSFDCLFTPGTPSAAPRGLSSTGNPAFQAPWSFSGLPSISLPSGLDADGLPLGIQLIGAGFAEGKLIAVAHWCAKVLRQFSSKPDFPPET